MFRIKSVQSREVLVFEIKMITPLKDGDRSLFIL
jgi:hypothetical protein